jgi:hypothetical protein
MSTVPHHPDPGADPLDRDYAPGWQPKPDDKVRGVVVDIDETTGKFGGKYPVVTLRLAPGYSAKTKEGTVTDEVAVHAFHAALHGRLAALEPKVGDAVGIKFLGGPLEGARSYRYLVDKYHDGDGEPSAAVNWDDYMFPEDRPLPAPPKSDVPAEEPMREPPTGDDDIPF